MSTETSLSLKYICLNNLKLVLQEIGLSVFQLVTSSKEDKAK
jgi:hypothetical protein